MKNKSKVLVLILSAAALVAASVFGTMAYLTDSDQVTNTFTVGNVTLGDGDEEAGLDEALVNEYGQPINNDNDKEVVDLEDAPRVKTNDYKLIPGHTYTKDPTVHIGKDSEDCWIFVKVTNEIATIETACDNAENCTCKKSVECQMKNRGWAPVENEDGVYAYRSIVSADDDIIVFDNFTIDGEKADSTTLPAYAGKTIVVTAYAVQADGFTTAQEAWETAGFED